MRDVLLVLLFFALALGGCAVTVSILQPTINTTASSWVQAEIRTDPVDDLVRFRKAERDGRAANILLPVFALLTAILLLLAKLSTATMLKTTTRPWKQPEIVSWSSTALLRGVRLVDRLLPSLNGWPRNIPIQSLSRWM